VCKRHGEREPANRFNPSRDERYQRAVAGVVEEAARGDLARFEARVATAIDPMNVAGFCDPRRRNWYPVDFETLIATSAKVGRTPAEIRALLSAQGMDRWVGAPQTPG
jgi:hypothetical protein